METLAPRAQEGTLLSDSHIDVTDRPTDHLADHLADPVAGDAGNCQAVNDILARVGDKWSIRVVTSLAAGPQRFNRLRREIDGISQRMLTRTLRALERDGLVSRTVTPTVPPRVDYALTPLGNSLRRPVLALGSWAVVNRATIDEARARFDASES